MHVTYKIQAHNSTWWVLKWTTCSKTWHGYCIFPSMCINISGYRVRLCWT